MTDAAVIAATFSDLKLIRGRKVCQLVFEIPVEQASKATSALGFPHAETWCAIARLDTKKTSGPLPHSRGPDGAGDRAQSGSPVPPVAAPAQPKPNSTRAVMMAKDSEFQQWAGVQTERAADAFIKEQCGVTSKSELNDGHGADQFAIMRAQFRAWRTTYRTVHA